MIIMILLASALTFALYTKDEAWANGGGQKWVNVLTIVIAAVSLLVQIIIVYGTPIGFIKETVLLPCSTIAS